MSKKFTEEQYQKIVDAWDNEPIYPDATQAVVSYVSRIDNNSFEQALLLAIPQSREWAHDKFVEKEKRYVWTSQISDDKGEKIRLHKTSTNAIKGSLSNGKERVLHDEELTESEVKEWGFDIDKFDKNEVDINEKKYVWTSKASDINGQHIRLWRSDWDGVSTSFEEKNAISAENEQLTESEIREWVYNPEMFDKEEV